MSEQVELMNKGVSESAAFERVNEKFLDDLRKKRLEAQLAALQSRELGTTTSQGHLERWYRLESEHLRRLEEMKRSPRGLAASRYVGE